MLSTSNNTHMVHVKIPIGQYLPPYHMNARPFGIVQVFVYPRYKPHPQMTATGELVNYLA